MFLNRSKNENFPEKKSGSGSDTKKDYFSLISMLEFVGDQQIHTITHLFESLDQQSHLSLGLFIINFQLFFYGSWALKIDLLSSVENWTALERWKLTCSWALKIELLLSVENWAGILGKFFLIFWTWKNIKLNFPDKNIATYWWIAPAVHFLQWPRWTHAPTRQLLRQWGESQTPNPEIWLHWAAWGQKGWTGPECAHYYPDHSTRSRDRRSWRWSFAETYRTDTAAPPARQSPPFPHTLTYKNSTQKHFTYYQYSNILIFKLKNCHFSF